MSFWSELKRRRVIRVGVAYLIVGLAVGEGADIFLPQLGAPSWVVPVILALVALGLPVALVLAWAYDVTPQGIERTRPADAGSTLADSGSTTVAVGVIEPASATDPESSTAPPAVAEAVRATAPGTADVSAETSQANPDPEPTPAPPLTSIAVLPFANMSDSSDNEYFSDGMTEDILAQIAHIGALDVVSHTSVKRYKGSDKPIAEIAAELNVGCVLEGSVRRAGDRVRIVAQLIDAATDRHLWAETYDRDLTDIFAVQSEVARSIAAALEAELTEEEEAQLDETPTESVEAYELVLKGRYELGMLTGPSIKRAIELYQAALEIQPDYEEAIVDLAMAYILVPLWTTLPPDEIKAGLDRVEGRLAEIDPDSAAAHMVTGALDQLWRWDWNAARDHFDEAVRLAPDLIAPAMVRALLEFALGNPSEALKLYQEARGRFQEPMLEEPTGMLLTVLGRPQEAIEILEPLIAREPLHFFPPMFVGASYVALGQVEKGLQLMQRARDLSHKAPLGETAWCAALYALGREAEAKASVEALVERSQTEYISPYLIASASVSMGDEEKALDYLERALEQRDPNLPYIHSVPRWRVLYGQPRFDAVFRAVFPGFEVPKAEGPDATR